MNTQFIKWWKAKFQSSTTCGYKNITVLGSDGSDGKHSDTEDLVRDDTSSTCTFHGAHINPGLATSSASSEHSNNHHSTCSINEVKFEDFECDVHVEGSEAGEARKEFSFTFYDLDGHGKVTKDDIAGLVRSIYGAVNESITVPQGGKKTVKVRLTVTPEKGGIGHDGDDWSKSRTTNHCSSPTPNNKNNNTKFSPRNSNDPPPPPTHSNKTHKLRNNVNVSIQETLNAERRFRHGDKLKFSSVRIPNHLTGCRACRNLSPEVLRDCSASPMRHRKKWRERSCSVQRPNLIELLQANMEKNNVSPCCRQSHHIIPPHSTPAQSNDPPLTCPTLPPNPTSNQNNAYNASHHHHHHHNNNHPNNNVNISTGKFKLQLDHHSFVSCHNNGGRNKLFDSPPSHHQQHRSSPPPPPPPHHHQCKKHTHHRSRSHDLGQTFFKYHLLLDQDQISTSTAPPQQQQGWNNNHSCSNDTKLNTDNFELLNGSLFSKTSNVENPTPSPHQLKHRNREQEHARAMAQVISWLERDIRGIDKKFSSPKKIPGISPPPVKKHEHHHVHEHIHHHYHHYAKETPIIV